MPKNANFNFRVEDEKKHISRVVSSLNIGLIRGRAVNKVASSLIMKIRNSKRFSMEEFISKFNLSDKEGVAILSLAESLIRIPDIETAVQLVDNKLQNKEWFKYISFRDVSFRTSFASIGLWIGGLFTDFTKRDNVSNNTPPGLLKQNFIRAVRFAIFYLSREFVFANDMNEAVKKQNKRRFNRYLFAFDLLGESARTIEQSEKYYSDYLEAIETISKYYPHSNSMKDRPNLSVKLTALYPHFTLNKQKEIDSYLFEKVIDLILRAKEEYISVTFDAEESFRHDIYTMFVSKVISDPRLKEYDGVGIVIQAYQRKSFDAINYFISLAKSLEKKINIRLVKGAYWDTDIKKSQEMQEKHYPVFTKKIYTDANYIAIAKLMLDNQKFVNSAFATHNALTVAIILEIGKDKIFEFQKLHGMGNLLHQEISNLRPVRIYAPVGKMKDLLPYLMRRMLENGANSGFINKIYKAKDNGSDLLYDLYSKALLALKKDSKLSSPGKIYLNRENVMGYEIGHKENYDLIQEKVEYFLEREYEAYSIIKGLPIKKDEKTSKHFSPNDKSCFVSSLYKAEDHHALEAVSVSYSLLPAWEARGVEYRADLVEKIGKILEENKYELYALLIKEAGKTIDDAINEVIEAIDFCNYYAASAREIMQDKLMPSVTGEKNILSMHPRGVFVCISPWNFPVAIFIGQIVAALVCGNTVIAKSSIQTHAISTFIVQLIHDVGIDPGVLNLLIVPSKIISDNVVKNEMTSAVAFTGSTHTARAINRDLSQKLSSINVFIAETGGQNAMIVDSSALLEQVTDDIVTSSFRSAGQRCSALRVVYIQEDIYQELVSMIISAMNILKVGNPKDFSVDLGPLIDRNSRNMLLTYLERMASHKYKIHRHPKQEEIENNLNGYYFAPSIIEVDSINDIPDEKFGPILHIVKYKEEQIDKVISDINNYGFGLTFGIHSRIDSKIDYLKSKIQVGNIYANRSMIGAKVESQPFGGQGKSGTGFKAGGPYYLLKFLLERTVSVNTTAIGGNVDLISDSDINE
ncbi:MAG TPA: bifunctional proline dehydrogenase/L-glutamate gamma-semialdehyde dehydrogenase PutA [Candidatus Megaira endosymbiont of Hartmannula sinica]|nr:bifunctional proline dehydrogenase/L-glutamate gamma-semialdehyde dehydrogenase PutA [Candidatus Megaera endosymbiont of Hartmannula sinica]